MFKHYDILTIFPHCLDSYLQSSLLAKAQEKKLLEISVHDLRAYTHDKHRRVDDLAYGGGSGMVMKPEPLVEAIETIKKNYQRGRVIYLSPQGNLLNQQKVEQLYQNYDEYLLVCGRYEGIDERVIESCVDEEISVGDYVLMGGELAAAIVLETTARLITGVVGKEDSLVQESHSFGLLEYPHYTRPEEFRDMKVPEVLLSGNHEAINKWRMEQAVERTKKKRPDLLK